MNLIPFIFYCKDILSSDIDNFYDEKWLEDLICDVFKSSTEDEEIEQYTKQQERDLKKRAKRHEFGFKSQEISNSKQGVDLNDVQHFEPTTSTMCWNNSMFEEVGLKSKDASTEQQLPVQTHNLNDCDTKQAACKKKAACKKRKKNGVLKGFIYIDSAEFSRKHETKSEQSTVGKFNFD
ncbi:hypothetical protein NGRA_3436, partial [Nosema granulosis]